MKTENEIAHQNGMNHLDDELQLQITIKTERVENHKRKREREKIMNIYQIQVYN